MYNDNFHIYRSVFCNRAPADGRLSGYALLSVYASAVFLLIALAVAVKIVN